MSTSENPQENPQKPMSSNPVNPQEKPPSDETAIDASSKKSPSEENPTLEDAIAAISEPSHQENPSVNIAGPSHNNPVHDSSEEKSTDDMSESPAQETQSSENMSMSEHSSPSSLSSEEKSTDDMSESPAQETQSSENMSMSEHSSSSSSSSSSEVPPPKMRRIADIYRSTPRISPIQIPLPSQIYPLDIQDMFLSQPSQEQEQTSVTRRTVYATMADIVVPSQENPIDIIGPSQSNKAPLTFVCTVKPAIYLKFATEALSDPEINQTKSGRIDVDFNGFNVTVQNSGNNAFGHLCLNPTKFRCTKLTKGKRVDFGVSSRELADVEDDGTVYVNNREGIEELSFFINGTGPINEFSAELTGNYGEIRKVPEMSLFCEATVPSADFRLMLQRLLQEQIRQQVSVDIKNNTATLMVGIDNSWRADYAMLGATGSKGMKAGQSYRAQFQFTHAELLQKASHLDAGFLVRLHTERPNHIVLRFFLRDLGYLEYMKELIP